MASDPMPIGAYISTELIVPPVSSGTLGGGCSSMSELGAGGFGRRARRANSVVLNGLSLGG
ncbi:hypothetical protein GCM10017774_74660 [Lentzea cavernae]|uniref:Uncharacterized protein n=1 Tax=Lentzea cavernae TaxID=2020703 RepID=A0ABQ3MPN5_9PSEU|nr:hypothetical protein GCM10017774_74660 [Lentzea cavernae]